MLDREFSAFLAQLSVLTLRQQDKVREALKVAEGSFLGRFTEVVRSPEQCPHCQAEAGELRPWGLIVSRMLQHNMICCRPPENPDTRFFLAAFRP